MGEFKESHHPFIHDTPRPTLVERLESGAHHLADKVRHLGSVTVQLEAPPVSMGIITPEMIVADAIQITMEHAA